ncbi:hypothetical protein [Saccharopolyspora rectivirgula]|uniref:Uncharacterized protein n=1 Tax=Saccharopolyspora rectivirgula TaxID=28042 RepID=A0A073B1Q4_9PSEU|nr:hypothetical protein [Saccharopolyspora rectivirgula]KEI45540.1 hypothetical protein GU90_03640 [Saccharopolyspora rectivirgula]
MFADQPGRDAVLFGDHIANVPGEAFLVLTTQRLAVVVKEKHLEEEQQESSGGGFFGRARAVVSQVQNAAKNLASSENVPATYFEVPLERIADMQLALLGRSIPRPTFLRTDFTDGSTLFTRTRFAEVRADSFRTRRPTREWESS